MQGVYIEITTKMEFQVVDHVKWNRMLASIPSAAGSLTAVHLIRETIIKPAAVIAVDTAKLQPVTREKFITRLINFIPQSPTVADYMRDLLLIRDNSTLGFNLHPQTHFEHKSGMSTRSFAVCADLATCCKCERAVLWSSASSHATSPCVTWKCPNHSRRPLPTRRSASARLKQSSPPSRLRVRPRSPRGHRPCRCRHLRLQLPPRLRQTRRLPLPR